MKEMSIDEIVNLADSYSKNKIPWHHHFLTVKCNFNHGKKFQIILENEKTGESFVSEVDHRPMEELERLEI